MPIYEYRCDDCGHEFEKLHRSINKIPAEIPCPACASGQVQRLMSAPVVHGGEGGPSAAEAAETDGGSCTPTSATPNQVFGRKELQEAAKVKARIKDEVASGG